MLEFLAYLYVAAVILLLSVIALELINKAGELLKNTIVNIYSVSIRVLAYICYSVLWAITEIGSFVYSVVKFLSRKK